MPTEIIFGNNSKLDSLGFVSLIVAVEQEIEKVVGSCPNLIELIAEVHPGLLTIGDLVTIIEKRI